MQIVRSAGQQEPETRTGLLRFVASWELRSVLEEEEEEVDRLSITAWDWRLGPAISLTVSSVEEHLVDIDELTPEQARGIASALNRAADVAEQLEEEAGR